MSINFRVLGGGFGGRGSADFIFMGARIFLTIAIAERSRSLWTQFPVQFGKQQEIYQKCYFACSRETFYDLFLRLCLGIWH